MPVTKIQPRLGRFDTTMIVISLVIGMGIFRTPAEVAGMAGLPEVFFLAWIAGAAISFLGALTFAEIGSRYPVAGGFYKIFSFCYNPTFAFMVNWITVISNAAANAAVALMGSAYIAPLLYPDSPESGTKLIAIVMICVLMLVNLLGVKVSAIVLNFLMIVKIALILLLIAGAFFVSKDLLPVEEINVSDSYNPFKAFILCFVPVFFTFGGYQQTINFGGDVRNPSRVLPRSTFIGILVILVLYLGINYSYYTVLGLEGLANTETMAADVAQIAFGKSISNVISVIMFFAVMTFVNVSIISNPRVYYAMAEDKVMPAVFMRVNQKTQVQLVGVLVFCAFIFLTLIFNSSFSQLLNYVMFFDSISLIAAAAAIFILRKRKTNENEPIYKMKWYPWVPIAYISIYSLINVSIFMANPSAVGWGALLFIAGYPLYLVIHKLINHAS